MGRRKKEFEPETPVVMNEDAMNIPFSDETIEEEVDEIKPSIDEPIVAEIEPKSAKITPKKIDCTASRVNVRSNPEGDILYTIPNLSKVLVEEEKDGWCKIVGYVMSELVRDL